MSFYPPIPWNTQFFHMAARISILSDLQIILNILKHILQNAVGAKPIQFYHKPRETDGKHLYLNIQVTYEVTQSAMMTKNTLLIHFFLLFLPHLHSLLLLGHTHSSSSSSCGLCVLSSHSQTEKHQNSNQ